MWTGTERRRRTWRDRTVAMVPVMIIALMTFVTVTAVVALGAIKTSEDNCESIHKLVVAGSRVIDRRTSLNALLKSGQITREQYDRAVESAKDNLRIWVSGDCPPPPPQAKGNNP